jgi:hypothetical protein
MNIKIAKIENNYVVDTYFMSQAEFSALDDATLVRGENNTEIGDIYDPASSTLSAARTFGVPKNTEDVPPMPNVRYEGETFTYNVATNGWDSTAMIELRANRDNLLKETDYTQTADFPESTFKTSMIAYRQELRDLPEVWFSNPIDVVYPEVPSTIV